MRILISGAGGGFGSELIKHFDSFEVIFLRAGGINDEQKEKLSKCDVFIHCGALLKGNFSELFNANCVLVNEILDYFKVANSSAQLIFFSTMSLLRNKKSVSAHDYLDLKEMTDYALSKYLMEAVCSRYKMPITIVRFSTLFYRNPIRDGLSKMIFDAVNKKRLTLYNGGEAARDFMPLDIAAQYVKSLVGNKKFFGRTANIVSGNETSFRTVAVFLKSRLNGLEIVNENTELKDNIPSNFDKKDILDLGEIPFSIFERVEDYIKDLQRDLFQ